MPHKITPRMTIGEILIKKPDAIETLQRYGLGCSACPLNTMETLEEGAHNHGFSPDEVKKLLRILDLKP